MEALFIWLTAVGGLLRHVAPLFWRRFHFIFSPTGREKLRIPRIKTIHHHGADATRKTECPFLFGLLVKLCILNMWRCGNKNNSGREKQNENHRECCSSLKSRPAGIRFNRGLKKKKYFHYFIFAGFRTTLKVALKYAMENEDIH